MPLKSVVSDLSSVSEALRTFYKAGEGKYEGKHVLDVEAVDGLQLDDVVGLKNTLSKLRTEIDEQKAKLKSVGGVSPEEAREAVEKLKKIGGDPTKAVEEQIDAFKKQMSEKHRAELQALQTLVATRDAEVDRLMIDAVATAAIAKADGKAKLLMPVVKAHCKIVRDSSGNPQVFVLQEDGKSARISLKPGSNENMTIDEFVETLRGSDDYAPAFRGTNARGTGTGGAGGGQSSGSGRSFQPPRIHRETTDGRGGSSDGSDGQNDSGGRQTTDYVQRLKEARAERA